MRIIKNKKPPKRTDWPITILYDDREKKGRWNFKHAQFEFVKRRLKVGDYTIEGLEDTLVIERKANFAELLQNVTGSKRKADFKRKLSIMSKYEYAYFVIEEPLSAAARMLEKNPYTAQTIENIYYWLGRIAALRICLIFMDTKRDKKAFLYYFFEQVHEVIQSWM